MEIIKIAPETLEALQNAPCAQPPLPAASAASACGQISADTSAAASRKARTLSAKWDLCMFFPPPLLFCR